MDNDENDPTIYLREDEETPAKGSQDPKSEPTLFEHFAHFPTVAADGSASDSQIPVDAGFGRFQNLTLIAEGGMGLIFRATDPAIEREIAIKVLRPHYAAHQEQISKFQNELRLTGQLEHPNIVPVHETGCTEDGRVFFCMKLVQGESLAELLEGHRKLAIAQGHPIDPSPFLRHLLRVCDAISFAHSREIVHRDLKPANIMIGAFGEVLVMDWGIARKIRESQEPSLQDTSNPLPQQPFDPHETTEGTVMGTLAYMAPEQAQGRGSEIDARTDVYCLGGILYDILTGTPPHTGKTTHEILKKVRVGALQRPQDRNTTETIPAELDAVIMKAMAPDKRDRYPTVQAFQRDIRAYLEGHALDAATYSPLQLLSKWVARNRKVCTAVASVVVVAVAIFSVDRWREWSDRESSFEQALASAQSARENIQSIPTRTSQSPTLLREPHAQSEETPEERTRREQSIQAHLTAVRHLERALQIHPDRPSILRQRIELGRTLGDLALDGRDYLLARAAYERLADFGLASDAVNALLDRVDSTRDQRLLWRRKRLEFILDDLSRGLSRSGRPPGAPLLPDYIFEAVGYRDLQTVRILGNNLQGLIDKTAKKGPGSIWTQPERDRATFICRVLGRLDLPSCVEVLGKWMAVVTDHELAIESGVALCNTRRPEAKAFLFAARDRLGGISQTWFRIQSYFDRVPEEENLSPPKTANEFFERGMFFASKREFRRAILAYTQSIELDPDVGATYNNRGIARAATGDIEGAIDDYSKALERNPNDIYAYNNRAISFQDRGDLDQAVADTTRAIQIDPTYAIAYHTRGYSLLLQGNTDAAIQDFNRSIELDPKNARPYKERGNALMNQGKLDAAISAYTQAIQVNPKFADAYNLRALALSNKQQFDAAISDFSKAIRIDPQFAIAYYNRGLIQQRKGEKEEAIEDYSRCIQLLPEYAEAHINRGIVREEQEDFEGAIADVQEGLRLRPDLWNGWYSLGISQTRIGQYPQALQALQKALPLAPQGWKPKISEMIRDLQSRQ